jgi:hypothetical protein
MIKIKRQNSNWKKEPPPIIKVVTTCRAVINCHENAGPLEAFVI